MTDRFAWLRARVRQLTTDELRAEYERATRPDALFEVTAGIIRQATEAELSRRRIDA
jgi:hypothetical protein